MEVMFTILADVILLLHALFVGFVVSALLAIYAGCFLQWAWVRNRKFRIIHLLAIAIVVLQSWSGIACPLTTWEIALREAAGAEVYTNSFIQHWLQALIYYRAPDWVFVLVYTGFGGLVLAAWWLVRPYSRSRVEGVLGTG